MKKSGSETRGGLRLCGGRYTRLAVFALTIVVLCSCLVLQFATPLQSQTNDKRPTSTLQANSLCATDEHIIFSCAVKRTAKLPAKIVSLCASRDLDKERGYLQYRFGLPGKVELEFPKGRQGTQQQFRYSHYFRYQVNLTEIGFNIDGYEYQIFDDYNGEEKPSISSQGVSVTAPGKPKEVSFVCASKPKTDYSNLQDVLPHDVRLGVTGDLARHRAGVLVRPLRLRIQRGHQSREACAVISSMNISSLRDWATIQFTARQHYGIS